MMRLAVLYRDGLKDIGDVFAAIDGEFKELVDFFVLHDGDSVHAGFEKVGNEAADQIVGHIFQAVDLDAFLLEGFAGAEFLNGNLKAHAGGVDDFGEFDHTGRYRVDAIGGEAEGTVFDGIEDIVHGSGDGVEIFGIDGSNEGSVEAGEDLMSDFIGIVLEALDDAGVECHGGCATLHAVVKRFGGVEDQIGMLFEQSVEFFVAGKQIHVIDQVNGIETMKLQRSDIFSVRLKADTIQKAQIPRAAPASSQTPGGEL
jgi:hypothetical protein